MWTDRDGHPLTQEIYPSDLLDDVPSGEVPVHSPHLNNTLMKEAWWVIAPVVALEAFLQVWHK